MNPLTVRHETNHSVFINAVNATGPKCEFSTMKIVGSYSAMYCFMFIAWVHGSQLGVHVNWITSLECLTAQCTRRYTLFTRSWRSF